MKDRITNQWFFKETNPLLKLLLIFVNGDLIFLFPLVVLVGLSFLLSQKVGLFLTGVYISVRFMGEIIYWMSQQFSDRKYRPNDFGFKNLDNHAAYILYQTFAICGVVAGIALIFVSFLR